MAADRKAAAAARALADEARAFVDAAYRALRRKCDASEVAAVLARAAGRPCAAQVGCEVLGMAVAGCRLDVAKVCVAAGADPRTATDGTEFVMHLAARRGAATLAWVLGAGGDAQMRADYTEQTPLMAVGGADAAANVAALLDAGADLEAVDRHGQTPLMWAAMNAEPEAVAALVDAGADPHRRSDPTRAPHGELWLQARVPGGRVDEMVGEWAASRFSVTSRPDWPVIKDAVRAMLAAALAADDHEAKRAADVRRRTWPRRLVAVVAWLVVRA